jgi:hypothetical protein
VRKKLIGLFLVVVQAETEAAMKQAQSASRAAESLLKNDGKKIQQVLFSLPGILID